MPSRTPTFDAKIIELTAGNIRNDHIYLREALHLVPADSIGGTNKDAPGEPVSVTFIPGDTVQTDIDSDKKFLRCRGPVRDFFERSGAQPGDEAIFIRRGEREFEVRLLKKL